MGSEGRALLCLQALQSVLVLPDGTGWLKEGSVWRKSGCVCVCVEEECVCVCCAMVWMCACLGVCVLGWGSTIGSKTVPTRWLIFPPKLQQM